MKIIISIISLFLMLFVFCASSKSQKTDHTANTDLDTLLSWDRGFDAQGKQVWGAEKSGYIFIKMSGK